MFGIKEFGLNEIIQARNRRGNSRPEKAIEQPMPRGAAGIKMEPKSRQHSTKFYDFFSANISNVYIIQ